MTNPVFLFVVRHAPPVKSGLCYGQRDIPVHPAAEEAALQVVRQLPHHIDVIYCSPSARTRMLALALSNVTGIEYCVDARLAEVNFGQWEGREWNEIHRTEPDALTFWAESPMLRAPPQGETGQALVERVLEFVGEQELDHALLVCHAGPIRALRALGQLAPELRRPHCELGFDFERAVEPLVIETIPWG